MKKIETANKVKWIKIVVDMFEDEKIMLLETMPEGDTLIVIWFKLLCLCGKVNRDGWLLLTSKLAYTDEMLASIFRRKENVVKMALQTFQQLEMIEIVDDTFYIRNWEKHQNIDRLKEIREYNKVKKRESRARKKLLENKGVNDMSMTCQRCQDIDIDKDKDKEEEIEDISKEISIESSTRKRFIRPTLDEVKAYIEENNFNVNAQYWYDYYESNGWKVGKNSMKDWKATIRRWNKNELNNVKSNKIVYGKDELVYEDQDINELRERLFGRKEKENE